MIRAVDKRKEGRSACATDSFVYVTGSVVIPTIDLMFSFLASDTVAFLDPTNEFVSLSIDEGEIVVG